MKIVDRAVDWYLDREQEKLESHAKQFLNLLQKHNQVVEKPGHFNSYLFSFKNDKVDIRVAKSYVVGVYLADFTHFGFIISMDYAKNEYYISNGLDRYLSFKKYLETSKITLEDLFS